MIEAIRQRLADMRSSYSLQDGFPAAAALSREQECDFAAWKGMLDDIDTLLAEVERLRTALSRETPHSLGGCYCGHSAFDHEPVLLCHGCLQRAELTPSAPDSQKTETG